MITYPLEGVKDWIYVAEVERSCEGRGGNIGVVSVILNSIYLGAEK